VGSDTITIRHLIPLTNSPPQPTDPSPPSAGRQLSSSERYLLCTWSNRGPLWRPSTLVPIARTSTFVSTLVGFFDGSFQPHLDQMQHRSIDHPASYRLHQLGMWNIIKVTAEIRIYDLPMSGVDQLVDMLPSPARCGLSDRHTVPTADRPRRLVREPAPPPFAQLDLGLSERPLLRIRLGYINPPHRLRLTGSTFQLLRQFIQPSFFAVSVDVLEGLFVYSCGSAVGFTPFVGSLLRCFFRSFLTEPLPSAGVTRFPRYYGPLARSPSHLVDLFHRKLRQLGCLRRRLDCYRVERTSSRAGVAPADGALYHQLTHSSSVPRTHLQSMLKLSWVTVSEPSALMVMCRVS
jgi:hypothetical protein